jgi:hypothetical protein
MKYLNNKPFSFGWSKKYEDGYSVIFRKSLKEKIQEFIEQILIYLFIK